MCNETKSKIKAEKISRACLSKSLTNYRERQNISREHLAMECEIDVKYLARIESCSANVSLDVLDKLSSGTGIPAVILIGDE